MIHKCIEMIFVFGIFSFFANDIDKQTKIQSQVFNFKSIKIY